MRPLALQELLRGGGGGCAQLLVFAACRVCVGEWVQTVDANNPAKKVEEREDVTFSGPVDR